ncbi:ATP-binding domain 1 family member B [Trichinella spiralis]|uniref:ATP-binding domain 1 family member B n=1 Tax=Trichinella spiralis TaxID=6334 RepID=UPI0001EFB4EE|nr:ATP-binding domain 1 family member B [Trichinella spiralis]
MKSSREPLTFGQVVIGPPGSGKTTYCKQMRNVLQSLRRKTILVNMDPANEFLSNDYDIDICKLMNVKTVMDDMQVGPNGGMVLCMEYVEKNLEWLVEEIKGKQREDNTCRYIIFDFPGQAELYTHCTMNQLDFRLAVVNLIDSTACLDPSQFLAALMVSLNMMVRLEAPHINVLSKFDLFERNEHQLDFNTEFYTEVCMPNRRFAAKYKKLSEALCEIIEDFGLDSTTMTRVLVKADRANGYIYNEHESKACDNLL